MRLSRLSPDLLSWSRRSSVNVRFFDFAAELNAFMPQAGHPAIKQHIDFRLDSARIWSVHAPTTDTACRGATRESGHNDSLPLLLLRAPVFGALRRAGAVPVKEQRYGQVTETALSTQTSEAYRRG